MDGLTVIEKERKKKHDMSTVSHAGFPPRAQAEDAVSQRGNYSLKQYNSPRCYKAYDSRMRYHIVYTMMIAAESESESSNIYSDASTFCCM